MRKWQFDVLFVVAIGGAIALLFLPEVSPAAVTGIGAIITFVLTQRPEWTRNNKSKSDDGDDDAQ